MEGPTCPNGHVVDQGFSYCPKCGYKVFFTRCPNGHAVDDAHLFCPTCGAPTGIVPDQTMPIVATVLRCPAGHSYEPGDTFCPTCGRPLSAPGVATARPGPPVQVATIPQVYWGSPVDAPSAPAPVLSTKGLPAVRPTSVSPSSRPLPPVAPARTALVKDKSVGAALVLTFFFGPIGLLYASVLGAFVLFVLGVIVGIATLGVGDIFIWAACMVWGAVAASNKHSRYQAWLVNQHGQAMRGWPPY